MVDLLPEEPAEAVGTRRLCWHMYSKSSGAAFVLGTIQPPYRAPATDGRLSRTCRRSVVYRS